MDAISNVETGFFRPIPITNDRILAYRYTATGFAPVEAAVEVREDINAIHYLGQEVADRPSRSRNGSSARRPESISTRSRRSTGQYER